MNRSCHNFDFLNISKAMSFVATLKLEFRRAFGGEMAMTEFEVLAANSISAPAFDCKFSSQSPPTSPSSSAHSLSILHAHL